MCLDVWLTATAVRFGKKFLVAGVWMIFGHPLSVGPDGVGVRY